MPEEQNQRLKPNSYLIAAIEAKVLICVVLRDGSELDGCLLKAFSHDDLLLDTPGGDVYVNRAEVRLVRGAYLVKKNPTPRKFSHRSRRGAPHEAAVELKSFLKDGERAARECEQYLKNAGFAVEKMNLGRVRRLAGVGTYRIERKWWWWLLSTESGVERG